MQAVVATVLSRMCAEPLHGPRVVLLIKRLLPPGHVTAIQVAPALKTSFEALHITFTMTRQAPPGRLQFVQLLGECISCKWGTSSPEMTRLALSIIALPPIHRGWFLKCCSPRSSMYILKEFSYPVKVNIVLPTLRNFLHSSALSCSLLKDSSNMIFFLQDGPGEAAVAAMTQESENPERVWNPDMATTTALEVANLANAARASQVDTAPSPVHHGDKHIG